MSPAYMTITGDKAVSRKFKRMGGRAEDMEPVWPKVGMYMRRLMVQQFASEGARLGKPWKPLKPEYKLWKMRNGFNRKTLVLTGAMRSGFVSSPMDIEEYRGNEATFGSSNQKAIWQQFGTHRNGKRVITPRPILFVTPEMRRDVKQMLKDYILSGGTL